MNSTAQNTELVKPAIDWEEVLDNAPESALEQAGAQVSHYRSEYLELREMRGVSLLRIHSLQTVADLNQSLSDQDIHLPEKTLQSSGPDPAALCLAPNEWLLFSEYLNTERLTDIVSPAVDKRLTCLLDVSCGYGVLRLSGSASPWLLSKVCRLDLAACTAGTSYASRTRMQHLAVTLHYHSPGGHNSAPVFDVITERSSMLHLWQLLIASIPHAEQLQQVYGNV